MASFENSVVVAKNVNFDLAAAKPHLGILDTQGKLPIGTGNSYPTPEILGGNIVSPNGSVTVGYASPNITVEASSATPLMFTENSGFAIPSLNNLNVFGTTAAAGTSPLVTSGADSTVTITAQRSQALAAGDSTKVGLSNFDSGDFTVSADGFVVLAGGGAGQTITGDSGGALSPTAGNWNILGQQAGTTPVMFTVGSGSTLNVEDRTWTSSLVVDPSSTVGLRGTFQTITAALAAASSGQTIFIRPGTYTESFTLKAGVNLSAYVCDSQNIQVMVIGVATATFSGSCSMSGIYFRTNGAAESISISGANATVVHLINCFIETTANTSLVNTASNVGAILNVISCTGNITGGAGSVVYQITGTGKINFYNSSFLNTGGSISSNNASAGFVNIFSSLFSNGVATQTTGVTQIFDSSVLTSTQNTSCIIINSNSGTTMTCSNCYLASGTAASVDCSGNSATMTVVNTTINTSNANAIFRSAGATPTIRFGNISFIGTSSVIDSTLIQVPIVSTNDAVVLKTPGAYPYTTIPQDGVILVDTSSARTITPLASPTTGQMHRIKDNTGSAGSNNITITPSGKNIDGVASFVIATNYGSADIVYNGTQWNVL